MSLVQDQIRETALRYGVDPALALAVAQKESGFDQSARGSSGEVGIFQLMPGTAANLGVNPYSQTENIEGGIRYLAEQINRFGVKLGLVAYNAGPTNVSRGTASSVSYSYAQDVLGRAQIYGVSESATQEPEAQYASFFPTLPELPSWSVWAGVGVVGLLLLLKRRD